MSGGNLGKGTSAQQLTSVLSQIKIYGQFKRLTDELFIYFKDIRSYIFVFRWVCRKGNSGQTNPIETFLFVMIYRMIQSVHTSFYFSKYMPRRCMVR